MKICAYFAAWAVLCASAIDIARGEELKGEERAALKTSLGEFFAKAGQEQGAHGFPQTADALLLKDEAGVRSLVWEALKAAPIHDELKRDFNAKQVRFEKHLSAYTLKTVGKRPEGGWPLVIAMHGGGGAPKAVNDSQWQHMQRYYRDHPEVGGYLYVALRAPNDTWNGFYDVYVYPLVENLIRQFVFFGDVDVNKVFLIGYSHGGYGAFAIGPKMPDRFAAIHASASAPTDGETTARTLRNTIFTAMVGERDTMYGRFDRCRKFAAEVEALRGGRKDIYPVDVQFMNGFGHGGLPDRDMIVKMYPAKRRAAPRELSWLMTDKVIQDFYWLRVAQPGKKQEIEARCEGNRVKIEMKGAQSAGVLLDSRLVDFSRPVVVEVNGRAMERKLTPSLRTLASSMQRRGDPELAFTAEVLIASEERQAQ